MRNAKQQLIGWALIGFIAVLALCAVGMVALKVMPPRDQARVLQHLPAPVRVAVNNWIFPHPNSVPAPSAPVHNISSLLTPIATRQATPLPTPTPITPSPEPSSTPTRVPIDTPQAPGPAAAPAPASAAPIAIPSLSAPGPKQAARSTPASQEGINVLLTGAKQEYQLWNNCGPATLSMNLGFYGWPGSQVEAAKFLKPDPEDKNVSPDQMVEFARSVGYNALHRVNGTPELIKALLRAGVPVLIEKGFEPEADLGWMGHYELIVGFNDLQQEFI